MKKVMLAANDQPNLDEINYPVLASGKIDGVRVCVQDRTCVAGRSLKPSINHHVMAKLASRPEFEGLDFELTVADEDWNNFNRNQSVVMTKGGKPVQLTAHVFDDLSATHLRAQQRKEKLETRVANLPEIEGISFRFCKQRLVHNADELRAMYDEYRELGYEGLIVCDPYAVYKHGRSTLKQGIMLKLKPSEDSEAEIVGIEELMINTDAGNSKRKENLVAGGMMGKLVVKWNGKEFRIGTGFTHAQRLDFWTNKDKYLGKLAKFKYMELTPNDLPRSPVYIGIRHKDDLGE